MTELRNYPIAGGRLHEKILDLYLCSISILSAVCSSNATDWDSQMTCQDMILGVEEPQIITLALKGRKTGERRIRIQARRENAALLGGM